MCTSYCVLRKLLSASLLIALFGCSIIPQQNTAHDTPKIVNIDVLQETAIEIPAVTVTSHNEQPVEGAPQLENAKSTKTTKHTKKKTTTTTTTTKKNKVVVEETVETNTIETVPTVQNTRVPQYITQSLTWLGMLSAMSIAWYTALKSKRNTLADGQMLNS